MDKRPVTESEISQLPRWAKVAIGIRAARRVQPLLRELWPSASADHVAAIDTLLASAERCATAGREPADAEYAIRTAVSNDVHYKIRTELEAKRKDPEASIFSKLSSFIAISHEPLFRALHCASSAAYIGNTYVSSSFVAGGCAWDNSIERALDAAATGDTRVLVMQRRDFTVLCQLCRNGNWNDASPVNPNLLGPLSPSEVVEGETVRLVTRS